MSTKTITHSKGVPKRQAPIGQVRTAAVEGEGVTSANCEVTGNVHENPELLSK